MSTKSEKLTLDEINILIGKYKKFQVKTNNPYILFFAKNNELTLSIYTSNKVVWQYREKKTIINNEEFIYTSNQIVIGSDEVGTGDIFGPIVSASVVIRNKKDFDYLKDIGINDSKKLDDKKIINIVKKLRNDNKIDFNVYILNNTQLNEMWNRYNLNEIKMFTHCKTINFNNNWVIDQFASNDNLHKYQDRLFEDNLINKKYSFISETKAESKYLAVAAASVIARYYFLFEIYLISKKFNINIKLGSNSKVVDQYQSILKNNKEISNFVKLKFKNINNLKDK